MPSPFPGMDPYLEDPGRWAGVHLRLIVAMATELNRSLPAGLVADVDEYVWLRDEEETHGVATLKRPDVFVPDRAGRKVKHAARTATTPTLTPVSAEVTLQLSSRQKRRRIVIQTADGEEVLTVIELLSPANKATGADRQAYLAKRGEYLASDTNLVEIDLLRDGTRMPLGRPRPPVSDYYVLVSAQDRRPSTSIWAFSIQQPMPVFPVPLGQNYDDVALDLKACLDRVYDDGRYAMKLRYDRPAIPPLDLLRAQWASELLTKYLRQQK